MNRLAPVLLALTLAGCAIGESGPRRVAQLHQGMAFSEAASILGKPHNVTHQGALTVYDYAFDPGTPQASSYYVIVGQDGLVRSYGPN